MLILRDQPLLGPSRSLRIAPYAGPDYSRRAFLFPGQGAARPGMLSRTLRDDAVFAASVRAADEAAQAAGAPRISEYFERETVETRPHFHAWQSLAIYTAGVALAASFRERGLEPLALTGYSFGEWAALTAAGVLEMRDAVRLIWLRELACPPAGEAGGLVALRADADTAAAVGATQGAVLAARCGPALTVLAHRPEMLPGLRAEARARRIALRVLDRVAQPYHSPWLRPAAETFLRSAATDPFAPGEVRVPWLSSVDGRMREVGERPGRDELLRLLSAQLVEKVDFPAQIEQLHARRVFVFVEAGPGGTCVGFAGDILGARPHRALSAEALAGAAAETRRRVLVRTDSNPVLQRLSRALGKITGYELESISLEDDLQADHGVDSLKKLDLAVSLLPNQSAAADAAAAQARTVGDLLHLIEAQSRPGAGAESVRRAEFTRMSPGWIESAHTPRTGPAPAAALLRARDLPSLVDGLSSREAESMIWVLEPAPRAEPASLPETAAALDALRDWWRRGQGRPCEITLVSLRSSPPELVALDPLLFSLARERDGLALRHVRFEDDRLPADWLEKVDAERACDDGSRVRWNKGKRERWALLPAPLPARSGPPPAMIVATGGAGGITHRLLRDLLRASPALKVGVVGRRSASDPAVAAAIRELDAEGRVRYRRADASDPVALAAAVEGILEGWPRPDLWINGAGVEHSGEFAAGTPAVDREILSAKIETLRHLRTLASRHGGRLIAFSSLASVWGNAGQAVYAYANAVVDAWAERDGRVASLRWPAWDGVGMAAAPGVGQRLRAQGIALLSAEEGVRFFDAELAGRAEAVVDCAEAGNLVALRPVSLAARARLAAALGRISDSGRAWRRRISLRRDPWLADHAPGGRALLPAAWYLAAAARWASVTAEWEAVACEDLVIHRPVWVEAEVELVFSARIEAAETVALDFAVAGSPAASLRIRRRDPVEAIRASDATGTGGAPRKVDAYEGRILFHGPAFHVLHEAAVHGGEALQAQLVPTTVLSTGDRTLDALLCLLDGLIQAAGLALAETQDSGPILPMGVESLVIVLPEAGSLLAPGAARAVPAGRQGNEWRVDARGLSDAWQIEAKGLKFGARREAGR